MHKLIPYYHPAVIHYGLITYFDNIRVIKARTSLMCEYITNLAHRINSISFTFRDKPHNKSCLGFT